MQKKYQVFVSSTFRDLIEERQDAIKSVLDIEHIPSGMEAFHAADFEQFEYIKRIIDECDYYILIIGARYGSTDADGISYTEREYDYAVSTSKTVLAFIHGDPQSLPVSKSDRDPELLSRLESFRSKVSKGRLVSFWSSREDLHSKIIISLSKAIARQPGVGWVRGDVAGSEDLLQEIHKLRIENDRLSESLKKARALTAPPPSNLASITDLFPVRLNYYTHDVKNTRTISLTWLEIFKAVGVGLVQPSIKSAINSLLVGHLQENRNFTGEYISIFGSDVDTIKFHLEAIGYLKSEVAAAAKGGLIEFVSLTDAGRAKLSDLMAVRAPLPST